MEEFNPFSPIQVCRRKKAFRQNKENRGLTKLSLKTLSGSFPSNPTKNDISDSTVGKKPDVKVECLARNTKIIQDKKFKRESSKVIDNYFNKLKNEKSEIEKSSGHMYCDTSVNKETCLKSKNSPFASLENLTFNELPKKENATRCKSTSEAVIIKSPINNSAAEVSYEFRNNRATFSSSDLNEKLETCVPENIFNDDSKNSSHASLTQVPGETIKMNNINTPRKRLEFIEINDDKKNSLLQCQFQFSDNSERQEMPQHSTSLNLRTKVFLNLDSSSEDLSPPSLAERLKITPKIWHKNKPVVQGSKCDSSSSTSSSGSEEFETFLKSCVKKSSVQIKDSPRKSSSFLHAKRNSTIINKANSPPTKLETRTCQSVSSIKTIKSYISPKSNTCILPYATLSRSRRIKKARHLFDSSDDSDIVDEVFSSPSHDLKEDVSSSHEEICNLVRNSTLKSADNQKQFQSKPSLSFLASLSSSISDCNELADSKALKFKQNFSKKKSELMEKLYDLFNETVFNNKLPAKMSITWNPRMRRTAGFCYYKSDSTGRSARIELASKVIDSAERLRDTLIHEMCHAASWLIHGYRDGHGPLWRFWAQLANKKFPELPVIARCHSYEINTKYVYKCKRCSGCIGRHSKSLDVNKKVCGRCGGRFELLVNGKFVDTHSSVRTPTGFALYVKENYKNLKDSNKKLKHPEIMKLLSANFHLKKQS